jgi:hypothetical protein
LLFDIRFRCPHTINYAELAAEMEDLSSNPEPPKQLQVPSVSPWLDGSGTDLGPPHRDPDLERNGANLVRLLNMRKKVT